ncbi:hypothetical protein [Caldimonas sp. KR1-144]|uniref:hypothetical protein n=1 Tax=Caldimonas sp. KR1-144 TaxID=3400911 RepID=UPI003C092AC0
MSNHKQGCDALGGYGNGVGPCSCGQADDLIQRLRTFGYAGFPIANEAATLLEQQAAEIERLTKALRRLCRSFPTDTDMVSAGWSAAEIEEGCAAHAAAYGILKEIGRVE